MASSASGFPPIASQSCSAKKKTPSGTPYDPLALVGSEKKSLGSPQSKQMSSFPEVEATESMVIDMSNDESDDELLLDDKGWNWDGRWD